jgi:VanZ family protein
MSDTRDTLLSIARWVPAIAWMAVIFSLSSVPGSSVPGRFGSLAHFVEYAILGALLVLAIGPRVKAAPLVAIALSVAYAVSDEFHQAFVPGRVPDPADIAVDLAGATLGALVTWWLMKKAASRRPPSRSSSGSEL